MDISMANSWFVPCPACTSPAAYRKQVNLGKCATFLPRDAALHKRKIVFPPDVLQSELFAYAI
jgi:hypothetical protein